MADQRRLTVNFKIKDCELELNASDRQEGKEHECIEADYFGDNFEIAFNWQFVQDFLKNCRELFLGDGGGFVRLETYSAGKGVIFRPEGSQQMTYVVMPLRW